jgi:hypothetical protein
MSAVAGIWLWQGRRRGLKLWLAPTVSLPETLLAACVIGIPRR